jgi:hypothetical protein
VFLIWCFEKVKIEMFAVGATFEKVLFGGVTFVNLFGNCTVSEKCFDLILISFFKTLKIEKKYWAC